ncbi:MAG TPA: acetate uptake transporter [Candidatus Dormibacteraeota bacterium]|nr:acetate uptake transporter [Candidatus Dormibacteraeota bacterium]
MSEVRTTAPPVAALANPAALGLAGFALTTFLLSVHNAMGATREPLLVFFGFAVFYGGLAQFCAGMWEFKAGNTFGATAFSTYGAFWMGVAATVVLVLWGKLAATDVTSTLAWILTAFAIFNTYMLLISARTQNTAVFLVFLTLEITEILLAWGNFNGSAAGAGLVSVGGWMGIITALVAWYTSAAIVANTGRPRPMLPVGSSVWPA